MSNTIVVHDSSRTKDTFLEFRVSSASWNPVVHNTASRITGAIRAAFSEKDLFTLEDVINSGWMFGFLPSEEELLFVQHLIAFWQRQERSSCWAFPTPAIVGSTYENIIGLKIWLRDHIAPVEDYRDHALLSIISSKMYLCGLNCFVEGAAFGCKGRACFFKPQPATCFKFLVEADVEDWKPNETCNDYFSSITADLIDDGLCDYLNYLLRCDFQLDSAGLLDDIPEIEVRR